MVPMTRMPRYQCSRCHLRIYGQLIGQKISNLWSATRRFRVRGFFLSRLFILHFSGCKWRRRGREKSTWSYSPSWCRFLRPRESCALPAILRCKSKY
ncbi:hypothetical protein K469DRAFT_626274, partial [Zopfia rhizophila CBS 207.26]